ncbi:MAG TPA: hypothetical protein PKN36_10955 [bacterium]|nr:hypothetical protein [bacterium]
MRLIKKLRLSIILPATVTTKAHSSGGFCKVGLFFISIDSRIKEMLFDNPRKINKLIKKYVSTKNSALRIRMESKPITVGIKKPAMIIKYRVFFV